MARHSHWHNIQLTKGKADAKRAALFGRLSRAITTAARDGGGDEAFNAKLRTAVEAAKEVGLPKEKILRAIARGTGKGAEGSLETVLYEGFGPGGAALLVRAMTDNRNRTASEIRMMWTKRGGTIGSPGSVAWMFEEKARVVAQKENSDDAFELTLIDAGAEDILLEEENLFEIFGPPSQLAALTHAATQAGALVQEASFVFVPRQEVEIVAEDVESLSALIQALEDTDDVEAVFVNARSV